MGRKEKEWFIGHIQEYPDYESQGNTVDELKENLIEISAIRNPQSEIKRFRIPHS
jgi:hypothetical protein